MTAPVFVDTNIFVYACQTGETRKQPVASLWIERLWTEQLGRTSIQVLNELYVTLTRKIRPPLSTDTAWDHVNQLLVWNPLPLNTDVLMRARELTSRYSLSWWDCLIIGAAQLQSCPILLTEDLQHQASYGGVTICNPFVLAVSEAPAAYHPTPVAISQHRPRGRPKRAVIS